MTELSNDPESRPRGVIDPAWEDELRRGQEAEGEAGSVEAELALLHLLRHVRQPETLGAEQLDSLWSAIEAEVAPTAAPWWRKAWLWWSAPALAAAAVLAVIVLDNGEQAEDTVARADERKADAKSEQRAPAAAPAPEPTATARDEGAGGLAFAAEEAESAPAPGGASDTIGTKGDARGAAKTGNSFEASFAQLAPHGRRAIRGSVDTSLDELRGQLLADARGVTR